VADGAVHVGDGAAGAAHDVVVVVADPGLVAGDRAGGLDPAHQPGRGQRSQHVVDGLVRDVAELAAYDADEPVRVRVRVRVHGGQHGQAGPGHAQVGTAQPLLELRGRRHVPTLAAFLERVKKNSYPRVV
jgi:hypothetical protein